MAKPFIDAEMEIKFYPVYPKSGLIQEIDTDANILFFMDYFSYTSEANVNHPCIMQYVTHSLFSSTYSDAAYYCGSLRKWSGFWTGSYVCTNDD